MFQNESVYSVNHKKSHVCFLRGSRRRYKRELYG